jgi:hypothetical protein
VLAELEDSGETTAQFARTRGLSLQRIYWWRRRLREAEVPVSEVAFAPVVVRGIGGTVVVRAGAFEVEVGDPSRVEPRWLAELVETLERSRC